MEHPVAPNRTKATASPKRSATILSSTKNQPLITYFYQNPKTTSSSHPQLLYVRSLTQTLSLTFCQVLHNTEIIPRNSLTSSLDAAKQPAQPPTEEKGHKQINHNRQSPNHLLLSCYPDFHLQSSSLACVHAPHSRSRDPIFFLMSVGLNDCHLI